MEEGNCQLEGACGTQLKEGFFPKVMCRETKWDPAKVCNLAGSSNLKGEIRILWEG